ncbi:MAG: hypothetical protein WDA00_04040 [Eubacteriales bacterium]
MLTVKPLESKQEQEAACARCAIPYEADDLAYGAYADGEFIGMCQFKVGEVGYIRDLVCAQGTEDFEALFIMGRGTLNFIDLCGVHTCRARAGAAADRVLLAIGFRRQADGDWFADMSQMFTSPCQAGKQSAPADT